MMWNSLRLRLVLAGAASVVLLLTVAAVGLGILFERHVERRAVGELSSHIDQLIARLERGPEGSLEMRNPPADPRYQQPFSGHYWQVDLADGVQLGSRSLWDSPLALPPVARTTGPLREYTLKGPEGMPLLVVERRAILPASLGGRAVRVVAAMDRAELRQASRAFLRDLVPFLGLLGAVLIAAGGVQVAVGLRPLVAVGARVSAVRSGAENRLGAAFPREVQPLAAEVDALIASRETDVERARARASDLAHALKTPLQALFGEARRLADRGAGESSAAIEEAVRIIQRHVDRELSRARIATGGWAVSSDPAAVAASILRVLKRTPDGAGLEMTVRGDEGLRVRIDAGDLTEALGALLENAARHARSRVSVEIRREGHESVIAVRDDGPGVAAEDLARLGARGARLDLARPGTGLGLAIVSDICDASGGTLSLANTGGGFEAAIRLPLAAPAVV
ncbi:MAG: HAMP domain-containing histidine kinase [Rhodobacteraceae bacterium]|nr:HAMP domain-containing histidine kinase [Paracoccaceae bacterium]